MKGRGVEILRGRPDSRSTGRTMFSRVTIFRAGVKSILIISVFLVGVVGVSKSQRIASLPEIGPAPCFIPPI